MTETVPSAKGGAGAEIASTDGKESQPGVPGKRRAYSLVAVLLMMALGYLACLPSVNTVTTNSEQHFGVPPVADEGARQLGIYAVILSIDPVNEALHLRLHFTPINAVRGERPSTPSRDLTLRVDDGHTVQEVAFHANQPMLPLTMEISLEGGSVAFYPFERLRAALKIAAQDGFQPAVPGVPGGLVPVRLTLWEGVAGWAIATAEEPGDGGQVRIRLSIGRVGALAFLVLVLYAMMALIAVAALTIGSLVFLRCASWK
jgi:hypothetical protein